MHQALLVPEVLLHIFAHLKQIGDPVYSSSSQKCLAALATTCKTFYEPAMDLLWAHMNSLLPLLACVTRLHPMIYPRPQVSWSRDIEPLSELERSQFLRHSGRVRSMRVSSDDDFHFLYSLPFNTCVFPNLHSLAWVVVFTRYLRFFLSPSLRSCYIAIVLPGMVQEAIGTRCPALEDLDIVIMGAMTEALHLSEIIHSCKVLTRLQCPPLDSAAWKYLSTIPTLLDVSIHQESLSFSKPPCKLDTHNLSFSTFLHVTILRFCYAPIADTTAVIQHSEFPSLKEFEFFARVLPEAELRPLLQALSQCNACHTLEKIAITDDDPQVDASPGDSLSVISELFCFTQLRTIRLFIHCSIDLDNDLLLQVVLSWPQLRSLSWVDPRHRAPKVTFRGLFTALRQAPHLRSLVVGLDVVNIDIDPKAESFQHTSLTHLSRGGYRSPAADDEAIARVIFAMLLNVRLLSIPWGNVSTHLESLKASSSAE